MLLLHFKGSIAPFNILLPDAYFIPAFRDSCSNFTFHLYVFLKQFYSRCCSGALMCYFKQVWTFSKNEIRQILKRENDFLFKKSFQAFVCIGSENVCFWEQTTNISEIIFFLRIFWYCKWVIFASTNESVLVYIMCSFYCIQGYAIFQYRNCKEQLSTRRVNTTSYEEAGLWFESPRMLFFALNFN